MYFKTTVASTRARRAVAAVRVLPGFYSASFTGNWVAAGQHGIEGELDDPVPAEQDAHPACVIAQRLGIYDQPIGQSMIW
jgi:hypothetical protein